MPLDSYGRMVWGSRQSWPPWGEILSKEQWKKGAPWLFLRVYIYRGWNFLPSYVGITYNIYIYIYHKPWHKDPYLWNNQDSMERIRPFFFHLKTMETNPSRQRSHIPPNGKIICDSIFISFYFSATKVYIKVSIGVWSNYSDLPWPGPPKGSWGYSIWPDSWVWPPPRIPVLN